MNMNDVMKQVGRYDTRTLLRAKQGQSLERCAKQGQSLERQQVYTTTISAPRGSIWDSLDNKTKTAIIRLNRMRP